MTMNSKKLIEELDGLIKNGKDILTNEYTAHKKSEESGDTHKFPLPSTRTKYQIFYTLGLGIMKRMAPERYNEFVSQYSVDKRNELNSITYRISDYLTGIHVYDGEDDAFSHYQSFRIRLVRQINLLEAAKAKSESILSDIEGIISAELFDNELEAAKELLEKGFLRAAGALAGVTLETHLERLLVNTKITVSKEKPTLADYNDALKSNKVFDITQWRHVQYLTDIRNECVHKKDKEPTKVKVKRLIEGVEQVKTY